jgi:tight adherence protein B
MSQSMIIFAGLIAVAVVLAMMGYFLIANRKQQQKRTLSIISGQSGGLDLETIQGAKDRRRADLAKKLQQAGDPTKVKKEGGIREMMNQAGWQSIPVKKYWIFSAAFAVMMTLFLLISGQPKIIVFFGSVIALVGLPRMFLKFKIARRQKKFLEEFADALESIVRLLKAGMPVGEAIAMVAREYTGPVGEEMSIIYDEQKIGIPLAEACMKAAERIPITEMQMFATGLTIQQQTGSSLSEILTNMARVIRARFRLKRKVQALSAEAKASAIIIGSLPVIVAVGLYLINPDYMEILFTTTRGKIFLFSAIGWMSIGVIIMRQMINFKV